MSAVSRFEISSARRFGDLALGEGSKLGFAHLLPCRSLGFLTRFLRVAQTPGASEIRVQDGEVEEGISGQPAVSLPGVERPEIRVLVNLCGLHLLEQERREVAAFVQKLHDLLNVAESHQLVLQELPARMNRGE